MCLQDVQAAAIRHVDVEQHQIPILLAQQVQSLVAAGGFAHGVDAGICFQELLESRADYRVIVSDQYS